MSLQLKKFDLNSIPIETQQKLAYILNKKSGRSFLVKEENNKSIIFIIFHETFENTNIFTTNKERIPFLIQKMEEKYSDTKGEWKFKEIKEETEFEASF
jgi:hypothetical protein